MSMDGNVIDLGKRIKIRREMLNMSQAQLAEILGVAKNTISNYERGKSTPKYETLMDLVSILDIPLTFLLESTNIFEHYNPIFATKINLFYSGTSVIGEDRRISEADYITSRWFSRDADEMSPKRYFCVFYKKQVFLYKAERKFTKNKNYFCSSGVMQKCFVCTYKDGGFYDVISKQRIGKPFICIGREIGSVADYDIIKQPKNNR